MKYNNIKKDGGVMILAYKVKNYKTFKNEVGMSFKADMRIKHFKANTNHIGNTRILKTIGVYGPNNTGKTCLLNSIYALKSIMLNERVSDIYNSFYNDYVTRFDITYEFNGNVYKYSVEYDSMNCEYLFEQLDKFVLTEHNNYSVENIFVRNRDRIDISLNNAIPVSLLNNYYPLFMMLSLKGTELEIAQNDYISFAKSIQIINMELPMIINKTLELMQKDEKAKRFIISFAKNCDLNIEDLGYSNSIVCDINKSISEKLSKYVNNESLNKELLKIWTKHHNHVVPSVLFDSIGTRKLVALAGYIYDAIVNGGVLIIDELDSSLHHVIIRAIIALFNNELNQKSQLVFSTHDALTMDLRRLFRKDQIYLTDITDKGNNKLIRLSKEYTSRDENGIRGNEDIVDYYLKGRFGGVPTPDLFDSLYEVLSDE